MFFFSLTKIYYNANYLTKIKGQTLDHVIIYKIKNIPFYEPAITLPKCNEKLYPQTCTWMLIAGLFITATN